MLSRIYTTLLIIGHWQTLSRISKSLHSYTETISLWLPFKWRARAAGKGRVTTFSMSLFTESSVQLCLVSPSTESMFYSPQRKISKLLPGWRTESYPALRVREEIRRFKTNSPTFRDFPSYPKLIATETS